MISLFYACVTLVIQSASAVLCINKDFWFTLDNLALNKPAYQEYPYTGLSLDFTDASNAVDGLKSDLSIWGKQCVVSANARHTATWWVNLINISSIHHITIFFRTGNYVWGMLDRRLFDVRYICKSFLFDAIF